MYPIISAAAAKTRRKRFPKLDWPIDQLEVGQAFVVPLVRGRDPDGRSVEHLRVVANRSGDRLNRRFTCSKTDAGLVVARVA